MGLFSGGAYSGYETRIMLVRDKPEAKVKVSCAEDVVGFVAGRLRNADREILLTISLDARNVVVGVEETSIGTGTQALVSSKETYKAAILHNAQGIIVVHSHPSGNSSPSSDDTHAARTLKEAGELLGIRLLDFIIIGDEEYCSFMDEGMLSQLPPTAARA